MSYSKEIEEALSLLPIARGYHDVWGTYYSPSEEAVRVVLKSLKFDASNAATLKEQLKVWQNRKPDRVIVLHGNENIIQLENKSNDRKNWLLVTEYGDQIVGHVSEDKIILPNGVLPGYHKLTFKSYERLVIVCPNKAYLPQDKEKRWGLSTQLYSAYSKKSEGIGDFNNLLSLSRFVQRVGGSFVGVNPLHLLFPNDKLGYSPYSPSSRRALNPPYIRLTDVPEFSHEDIRTCDSLRNNRQPLIDYQGVAQTKFVILRKCFHRLDGERLAEFKSYRRSCAPHLVHCALHSSLDSYFRNTDPTLWGWEVWPEAKSLDEAVKSPIAKEVAVDVDFHLYCQWEAERQLVKAKGGLELGLYLDLSVGVSQSGAEVWEDKALFALGSSSGAPPDLLNVQGQVWGLSPYIPWELSARGYKPFIETLQFQMQYAGALRIDHIMALQRLYWVPAGFSGKEGMYVHYPLKDLIGIVALESQRNKCVVVGEDLGTVPNEIREEMGKRDMLSYKVLYFMKNYDTDGSFIPVENYPATSLVTESTHDLPTLGGFLKRRDLEVRNELDLFTESITLEGENQARTRDIENLLSLIGQDRETVTWGGILEKVLVALAHSPSLLQSIQIEDLLGVIDQMNLPGTIDEHPNWKQKLPQSLDEILVDQDLEMLLGKITIERKS